MTTLQQQDNYHLHQTALDTKPQLTRYPMEGKQHEIIDMFSSDLK